MFLVLVGAACLSGCVGLSHSSHECTANIPGKYYRATRIDFKAMQKRPIFAPLIIALDLPFALIFETVEAPFVMAGVIDPRPKAIEVANGEAGEIMSYAEGKCELNAPISSSEHHCRP